MIALGSRLAGLAARAGKGLGDLIVGAGQGATGLREAFVSAYDLGVQKHAEQKRSTLLKARSQLLGLTPELYTHLAEEMGEQPLIEATVRELERPRGELAKALGANWDRTWRALQEDPFEPIASFGGWRERPSLLTWEMLEALAYRVPPFTAYLQTRLNQMLYYGQPQEDKHGPGFIIRKRSGGKNNPRLQSQPNGTQANEGETPEEDSRARYLEQVVINCGYTPRYDPETGQTRDGFVTFLRKVIRDSLIYDQLTFEKQRDRAGRIVAWRATDAKTMRPARQDLHYFNERREPIRYAQVINGTVAADFSPLDLAFVIRNPRTDIRSWGYGLSELEMSVGVVTALLNSFEHNARYFANGTTAKGVLTVHGLVPAGQLTAFRRLWTAMITGAQNAWRTPILNMPDEKSDVKWIDIQKSNLDMEWSKFMDWLLKVMCAIVQIAPEEIGFQFGNQGQTSSMGGQGGQREKVEAGKDKGLKPLLTWTAQVLNEEIIWPIDSDYEFAFVGLDAESEQSEVELIIKEQSGYLKVNEARAARNLPALSKEEGGEMILNPTWQQYVSQQAMQAGQQGGGGGMESQDPGAFGGWGGFGQEPQPEQAPPEPAEKSLTGTQAKRTLRAGRVIKYVIDL
jgi:hypothetical protein